MEHLIECVPNFSTSDETGTPDLIEGAIDSNAYLMIGYAVLAASLLCLVRSISGIIERQHNRARHFV